MKDRINESLSALCDGECDELELRRVLNHVSNDPEMRERWNRFNLIGAVMRDESARVNDISHGVMQALDGLPMDDVSGAVAAEQTPVPEQSVSRRQASDWLVSGAVAASVTLAVLFGARVMNEVTTAPSMIMASSSPVQQVAPVTPGSRTEPGMNGATGFDARSGEAVAMSSSSWDDMSTEELRTAQEALQQYVREQDLAPGIAPQAPNQSTPYARVANFGRDSGVKE